MADFLQLQDGVIVNLDSVVRVHPAWGSYRVDFVNGLHHTMSEADGEAIRERMRKRTTKQTKPK